MSYNSAGKRPAEYASRSSHSNIINDPSVRTFLNECHFPPSSGNVSFENLVIIKEKDIPNPIKHIIAIDGGYTEVPVRREFPSALLAFFQFGALFFSTNELDQISKQPFIDPADMEKLKQLERLKLTIPTKNITFKENQDLINSVRHSLHLFFLKKRDSRSFYDSLKWLLFKEFSSTPDTSWILSQCPHCFNRSISLYRDRFDENFTTKCTDCSNDIYLIDILRLHEAIDNELGAGGVLGYLIVTLEQFLLLHLIKYILETKPDLLNELLFIKDGPLAFFGQTANLHKPMRSLIIHLFTEHNLYLVGLEKSGPFVEHAKQIENKIEPGHVLLLNNEYIYKYIIPGNANPNEPYGKTTYYGNKVIYKSHNGYTYVATLPTSSILYDPQENDFNGLDIICTNLTRLKCDMYDSSLFPVALANKLVSLSNHPSSVILEQFAKQEVH